MTEANEKTAREFCREHGITARAERIEARTRPATDWDASARHFHVTLLIPARNMGHGNVKPGRAFSLEFSQGSAHTKSPTAADIIECLALDFSGLDWCDGFEDWAENYGYDTDSREAERIYTECKRQRDAFAAAFGPDITADLANVTE